jgi:hypothetical protein
VNILEKALQRLTNFDWSAHQPPTALLGPLSNDRGQSPVLTHEERRQTAQDNLGSTFTSSSHATRLAVGTITIGTSGASAIARHYRRRVDRVVAIAGPPLPSLPELELQLIPVSLSILSMGKEHYLVPLSAGARSTFGLGMGAYRC